MTFSVAFLIYDGLNVLDLAAPYDALASITRPETPDAALFDLHTISRTKEIVTCQGGLQLVPDHIYPDAHIYDVIIAPGGPGSAEAIRGLRFMAWIGRAARLTKVIAAVGTGITLLAAARLVNEQQVTTVGSQEELQPNVHELQGLSEASSSKILTVSSGEYGRDLGLAIAETLYDPDKNANGR
jgi:putative intracellular protease/amidase